MPSSARRTQYGIEYVAEVLDAHAETPTTHSIKVSKHPKFDFKPVQFTFLSVRTEESDDFSDYRPMSLACSPTKDYLEYGVRLSESPWKHAFAALKKGDEVMVEGPVGHFILDEERPAVLIAGGIGITPLKGMAEYAADKGLDIPVTLLYSNRSEGEIAYRRELESLAAAHPNLELVHTITRPSPGSRWKGRTGRIDEALLREVRDRHKDAIYYVCGTPGMVEGLIETLLNLKVPTGRIRQEEFWGYE